MIRRDDLEALIQRVRSLEGPDREVDGEIWRCIHGKAPRGLKYGNVPKLTASLDAVVSLIERELPEYTAWELASRGGKTRFVAELSKLNAQENEDYAFARAKTAPLALLCAALTAIKERDHE